MEDLFTASGEIELYRFPALFYPVAAVLALALQAYLPLLFHSAVYLDLPLLVVTYYALSSRQQAGAVLAGAALGILQDSVAHLALGLNGMAKSLAGFIAASLGNKLDAEHAGVRFLLIFALYEMNEAVVFVFERYLMAQPVLWWGSRLLVAGLLNGVAALFVFRLFDRFRRMR